MAVVGTILLRNGWKRRELIHTDASGDISDGKWIFRSVRWYENWIAPVHFHLLRWHKTWWTELTRLFAGRPWINGTSGWPAKQTASFDFKHTEREWMSGIKMRRSGHRNPSRPISLLSPREAPQKDLLSFTIHWRYHFQMVFHSCASSRMKKSIHIWQWRCKIAGKLEIWKSLALRRAERFFIILQSVASLPKAVRDLNGARRKSESETLSAHISRTKHRVVKR